MTALECWLPIVANVSWQVQYVLHRVRRTTRCAVCDIRTIRRGRGMCTLCAAVARIGAV